MMRRNVILFAVLATAATAVVTQVLAQAQAQARKPKLPPGRDPGGVAIAIAGAGIDYTGPEVAHLLARDGEGDLIGWDMIDGDNRPHAAADRDMSALALAIAATGERRIVPVRVDWARSATLAQAITFASRTPARVLVIALPLADADQWSAVMQAAARHPQLLVVMVAGATPTAVAAGAPANLLRVGGIGTAGIDLAVGGAAHPAMTAQEMLAVVLRAPERCTRLGRDGKHVANTRVVRLLELLPPLTGATKDAATPCVALAAP